MEKIQYRLRKSGVKLLVTTLVFLSIFGGLSSVLATSWTSYAPYYDDCGYSTGGSGGVAQAYANTNGWLKCYASAAAPVYPKSAWATASVQEEFTAPFSTFDLQIRVDVKFHYYAKCTSAPGSFASVKLFVLLEFFNGWAWVPHWQGYLWIDTVTSGSSSYYDVIRILYADTNKPLTQGWTYRIRVTYITEVLSLLQLSSFVQYSSTQSLKSTCYVYSINIGYD